jgi:hypothetical protein
MNAPTSGCGSNQALRTDREHDSPAAIVASPSLCDLRQRDRLNGDLEAAGEGGLQELANGVDEAVSRDTTDAAAHQLDR